MTNFSQPEKGKTVLEIARTMAIVIVILAVLIIIGRLFWGVLFYETAADDTVKELASRAVSISGQILNGQNDKELSNGEFGVKTRKGYLVNSYMVDNNFFEITLSAVPKKICQRLLDRKWSMPTSVYVNDVLDQFGPLICKDTNKMSFEFSRDLSENIDNAEKPKKHHCLSDAMCSGCGACRNGLCQTGCTENETCSLTLTTQSVCCSPDKQAQGMCCSFIEDGQCCWGRGKCCPFDKPIYTTDGRCVDCYDPEPFAVGQTANLDTCRTLCPNRISFGQDNLCMLPICSDGQFMGQDGSCYDCAHGGTILTSETECHKCTNRTYQDGSCFAPCPAGTLQDTQGHCISCQDASAIIPATPATCETVCPNRHLTDQACALNTCPEDSMPDAQGSCLPCDTPEDIATSSSESCAQCPNRVFQGGLCRLPCPEGSFRSSDSICHSCSDLGVYPITPGSAECNKCPDRLFLNNYCFAQCSYGQFRDALGSCHDCQDLKTALVLQTAGCSLCPNRSIVLQQNGRENLRYCAPQYCPSDYFRDTLGGCHDCLTPETITGISKTACEQCGNRMWSPIDNSCLIKPTCEIGEVLDTYGKCHTCSELAAFRLNGYLENCDVCPNRYLFGSWCRTCPAQLNTLTNKAACQKCGGSWDNRLEKCH